MIEAVQRSSKSPNWQLLYNSKSRLVQRDWAQELDGRTLDRQTALRMVANVLRDQWLRLPSPSDEGLALLEGMLALDRFVNELPASEKEYAAIVEKSKDDYGAFQALRFLLAINTDAWSDAVRSWKQLLSIGAVQIPPRPKGPSKASYIWRDRIILSQIQNLVSVGFHAQRNQETVGATSACDVISEATHMIGTGHSMNYGAVEAIWKKRADLQLPIAAASLFKIDPASYRKS